VICIRKKTSDATYKLNNVKDDLHF